MRSFRLSKKNVSYITALIVILVSLINQLLKPPESPLINQPASLIATSSAELVKVKRVIDGDTIELETKQKVRYIGVDTPELHDPRKKIECYGKEAMEENKKLVEGKMVRLEKDISETDKFKRLLRYVYIPTEASPSGIFVNDYLVKEGYAFASTFPPDVKFANLFLLSQQEAKAENKGLWSKCR